LSAGTDDERRRRIRRSTLLLALLAVGVYVLFIALSVRKGL
jgi:ABC-type lipoprotein release transport system permease subunit